MTFRPTRCDPWLHLQAANHAFATLGFLEFLHACAPPITLTLAARGRAVGPRTRARANMASSTAEANSAAGREPPPGRRLRRLDSPYVCAHCLSEFDCLTALQEHQRDARCTAESPKPMDSNGSSEEDDDLVDDAAEPIEHEQADGDKAEAACIA